MKWGDLRGDHLSVALSGLAAAGLHHRERTVRRDVHLHVAQYRFEVVAVEFPIRGPVMVYVVDEVCGVLARGKGRRDGFGNLMPVYLGLGILPCSAAVEQQFARRAAVEDLDLGHTVFVVDVGDAGIGIVRADVLLDARRRLEGM